MGNAILSIQLTLDGFIDHTEMIADEDTHRYAVEVLDTADVVLFGRVTYQLMAGYWPSAESDASLPAGMIEFARKINSIPKIVLSQTLEKAEWENTRLLGDEVVKVVSALRKIPEHNVLIAGSALANKLMQHGLIDDYRLQINPVILGKGTRLFREGILRTPLKLVETKVFRSGVVLVHYQPVR
jgi:dihydrofolate reductase